MAAIHIPKPGKAPSFCDPICHQCLLNVEEAQRLCVTTGSAVTLKDKQPLKTSRISWNCTISSVFLKDLPQFSLLSLLPTALELLAPLPS